LTSSQKYDAFSQRSASNHPRRPEERSSQVRLADFLTAVRKQSIYQEYPFFLAFRSFRYPEKGRSFGQILPMEALRKSGQEKATVRTDWVSGEIHPV